MFLALSALAYLAISMAVVLAIDIAICRKYRQDQPMKSTAPAFARATLKQTSPSLRS